MNFKRRGIMLVIASPSGAGKTSITRSLLQGDENLTMSISLTTRPMRKGEVDGKDYHFRTIDEFNEMRDAGELLEWAKVHDNYYATPRFQVDEMINSGRDVVFDIDYQGTQQLYEKCRADMVTTFILPPSIDELHSRLKSRALDSEEVISRRLKNAKIEIDHWAEYDYVLVNKELPKAIDEVKTILKAARISRVRQTDLSGFIKQLQAQIDEL